MWAIIIINIIIIVIIIIIIIIIYLFIESWSVKIKNEQKIYETTIIVFIWNVKLI